MNKDGGFAWSPRAVDAGSLGAWSFALLCAPGRALLCNECRWPLESEVSRGENPPTVFHLWSLNVNRAKLSAPPALPPPLLQRLGELAAVRQRGGSLESSYTASCPCAGRPWRSEPTSSESAALGTSPCAGEETKLHRRSWL